MTAAHQVPGVPGKFVDSHAARPDWELIQAIAHDCGQSVSVIDRQGRLFFATSLRQFSPVSTEPPRLCDIFDAEVTAERLEVLREALDFRRPISMIGMIAGRWMHSTYRPLPPDDSTTPAPPGSLHAAVRAATEGAVLTICRPVLSDRSEFEPPVSPNVRTLRYHDLGDLAKLNQRELQVLHLIGLGLSSAEIARSVHRSVKAVEWYRGWIAEKLALHDKADAVRFAAARGLPAIPVERWTDVIARQPGGPAFEVHIEPDVRRN